MKSLTSKTFWARIYMSGPIEQAKALMRKECMRKGLCVTIEPTQFIYTGGEELGYVVGLIQYPRFPSKKSEIDRRAIGIAKKLMRKTWQWSGLVMFQDKTVWISQRKDSQ